jgi:hypothetical protein
VGWHFAVRGLYCRISLLFQQYLHKIIIYNQNFDFYIAFFIFMKKNNWFFTTKAHPYGFYNICLFFSLPPLLHWQIIENFRKFWQQFCEFRTMFCIQYILYTIKARHGCHISVCATVQYSQNEISVLVATFKKHSYKLNKQF